MWMSKELQVLYFSFNLSNYIQGLEFLSVENFDSNLVSRQLMFCHSKRMRKEFNKLFPICFTFTSTTTGRSLDDIKSCLQFIIIWINTDQSQFLRKQAWEIGLRKTHWTFIYYLGWRHQVEVSGPLKKIFLFLLLLLICVTIVHACIICEISLSHVPETRQNQRWWTNYLFIVPYKT